MNCNFCNSTNNLIEIFSGKYPLFPYVLEKELKKNLNSKFKKIIDLKYYLCKNCGLVLSDLNKKYFKLLNMIYKKHYKHYSRYGVIDFEIDSFLEFIDNYLENSKSLLEIGCFDGYFLYKIMEKYRNLKLIGIDPVEEGIQEAKKHGISCICDFFPSPLLKSKFDIILSSNVIEHLDDPFNFLKIQKDFLNKGGIIVFETPNFEWSLFNTETIIFHPQHLKILSIKYIKNILTKLNLCYFKMVEITHRILFAVSEVKYDGMKNIIELETNESTLITKTPSLKDSFIDNQENLANLFEKLESFAIWGAGSFTGKYLAVLKRRLLKKIDIIVDSDTKKINHEFIYFDKEINHPSTLREKKVKNLVIMSQYIDEILLSIKQLDLNYSIIIFSIIGGIKKYYYNSSKKSIEKIL